jgi:hypothetical protein
MSITVMGMTCRYNTFTNKGFFFKLVALFDSQTLYAKRGGGFSSIRVENPKWIVEVYTFGFRRKCGFEKKGE